MILTIARTWVLLDLMVMRLLVWVCTQNLAPHRLHMCYGELDVPLWRNNLLRIDSPYIVSSLGSATQQHDSSQARPGMTLVLVYLRLLVYCSITIGVII